MADADSSSIRTTTAEIARIVALDMRVHLKAFFGLYNAHQKEVAVSEEILFFHHPVSRARIAHFMLEEVGAPYRMEILRFDKAEHKKERYLGINPMGKIPAIIHRDTVITEAAAICAYLADVFPEAGLAPTPDDPARGTYFRWLFFGAGCLEPAVIDHVLARPRVQRPSTLGYGSYEDTLGALEKAVTPGPFILGDRFSSADVYIGSQIGWGLMTKGIEARPAFTAYLGRVSERPAFKRMAAQNEELAKKLND
jgi:glutathione S-transferase